MRRSTSRVRAVHGPCGTIVEEAVPDDHPAGHGVGLWCPACHRPFWHVPEAPSGRFLPPRPPELRPPARAPGAARSRESRRHARRRPAPAAESPLAHIDRAAVAVSVAILLLAGIAAALLTSGSAGPEPVLLSPPRPAPTALAQRAWSPRRVGGRPVRVARLPGWRLRTVGGALLAAPAAGGARVGVSARPLRGRSLRALAPAARRRLLRELPGHRVEAPRPARVGGRPAVRVVARRGGDVLDLLLTAAGAHRFAIVLRMDARADSAVRRQARLVQSSVLIG